MLSCAHVIKFYSISGAHCPRGTKDALIDYSRAVPRTCEEDDGCAGVSIRAFKGRDIVKDCRRDWRRLRRWRLLGQGRSLVQAWRVGNPTRHLHRHKLDGHGGNINNGYANCQGSALRSSVTRATFARRPLMGLTCCTLNAWELSRRLTS